MRTLLSLCMLLPGFSLFATHNKSGEIVYRKTGPLTLEAKIITYTRAQSLAADRDTLIIDWGDGTSEPVARVNGVNGFGELITPETKHNIYTGTHTYAQAGVYTISMTDPNRITGIINLNPPASDNVPFHLLASVDFTPAAALSLYSPVLQEFPIDEAVLGQPWVHVPGAYDPDGDSLAFELVTPFQATGMPAPNYTFPQDIAPGAENQLSVDPLTGKIVWDAPQVVGQYSLAIRIKSYRDGQLVETVLRDMLVFVNYGENHPPMIVLDLPDNQILEVHPGDTVTVTTGVSDPDPGQSAALQSSSGLYDFFAPPAEFALFPGGGTFRWVVSAGQLREQPYTVAFKAKDDSGGLIGNGTPEQDNGHGLATFKVLLFRVRQTVSAPDPVATQGRLQFFPNPTAGAVDVSLPAPAHEGARLRVLDLRGTILRDDALPAGTTRRCIFLEGLPPAAYQLQVLTPGSAPWSGLLLCR